MLSNGQVRPERITQMNTQYRCAAHPTPAQGHFDFRFATQKEMKTYLSYEMIHTVSERQTLAQAKNSIARDTAKDALAIKRKLLHKLWKANKQPTIGGAA